VCVCVCASVAILAQVATLRPKRPPSAGEGGKGPVSVGPAMSKRHQQQRKGRDGEGSRGRPEGRGHRGRTPGKRDGSSVPAPWVKQGQGAAGQAGGGSWDCMVCYNTANRVQRHECHACGAKKPERTPTWDCRSGGCHFQNWNTKIICHRCQAWRPDGTMIEDHGRKADSTTRNRAERDKATAAMHGRKEARERTKRDERRAGDGPQVLATSSASRRTSCSRGGRGSASADTRGGRAAAASDRGAAQGGAAVDRSGAALAAASGGPLPGVTPGVQAHSLVAKQPNHPPPVAGAVALASGTAKRGQRGSPSPAVKAAPPVAAAPSGPMGHVALLTAANKVLGKLRCSLQALKSASEGSDDPEQASAGDDEARGRPDFNMEGDDFATTQDIAESSEAAATALKATRVAANAAACADAAVCTDPTAQESHAAVAHAADAMTSANAAVIRAKEVQAMVTRAKSAAEVMASAGL
jgi:hypothetical protein